jgi:hypothetical protein
MRKGRLGQKSNGLLQILYRCPKIAIASGVIKPGMKGSI